MRYHDAEEDSALLGKRIAALAAPGYLCLDPIVHALRSTHDEPLSGHLRSVFAQGRVRNVPRPAHDTMTNPATRSTNIAAANSSVPRAKLVSTSGEERMHAGDVFVHTFCDSSCMFSPSSPQHADNFTQCHGNASHRNNAAMCETKLGQRNRPHPVRTVRASPCSTRTLPTVLLVRKKGLGSISTPWLSCRSGTRSSTPRPRQ